MIPEKIWRMLQNFFRRAKNGEAVSNRRERIETFCPGFSRLHFYRLPGDVFVIDGWLTANGVVFAQADSLGPPGKRLWKQLSFPHYPQAFPQEFSTTGKECGKTREDYITFSGLGRLFPLFGPMVILP